MRRRIAESLAVVLCIVSLGAGAVSGPSSQEAAKVTRPLVSMASTTKTKQGLKKNQPSQVGTASWYGESFQGKQTASGEPYDMLDFTAAHRTLPLGTLVRVTNLKNGRTVVVRINDRGPVPEGRIIDLSYNAARTLGFKERGLQKVRVEAYQPSTVAQLNPVAKLN
jgi:rare lipoprotein A